MRAAGHTSASAMCSLCFREASISDRASRKARSASARRRDSDAAVNFFSSTARRVCAACEEGKYKATNGSDACTECAPGFYSTGEGQSHEDMYLV